MNIPLLRRLREARGVFIPLAELGTDLDRVRGELDELEAFGFVLERHPYRGVAYRGPAGQFCPDQIEFELDTQRIGHRVAVWNRVTSTNDLAARASGSSANDGLVILAEEQSAGRGRRGRSWIAPAGSSLLMSVLLFPPAPLATAGWLTALGAVGTAEVVAASTGQDARIKWPNDVRIDGRKIAGVLVERGPGAIIGIGLNANLARDDFPGALRESATSLRILLGEPVDRSELARALIRRLDHWYELGRSQGPETLAIPWRDRSEHLGRTVRVTTPSTELVGHLDDLDLLQGLTVTLPEGRRHHVPLRDLLALGPADTEPGDAVTPSRSGG